MFHLTKPQKTIYDMEKYAGGSISNICGSILFRGKKSEEQLADAISTLYRLNDALRIRVGEEQGEPYQYVAEGPMEIPMLYFEDKAALDRHGELYSKQPMDLHGSLCEAQGVIMENSYGVLIKMHHLVSDAWTLALCGTQLSKILNGETPTAYSYIDYLQTEEKYLAGKRYAKDSTFFEEQFKKCDEVTYLSDVQSADFQVQRKTIVVDKEKTFDIVKFAQENNTSVFVVFMTVLGIYISRIKSNT